jgi:hypothetical protein
MFFVEICDFKCLPLGSGKKATCHLVTNDEIWYNKIKRKTFNMKPQKKTYRARGARLTIDCSSEQKRKIKILAASQDLSITNFLLGLVEEKYTWCPLELSHVPNEETISSIEESEKGKDVKSFDSIEDLYKDLGI